MIPALNRVLRKYFGQMRYLDLSRRGSKAPPRADCLNRWAFPFKVSPDVLNSVEEEPESPIMASSRLLSTVLSILLIFLHLHRPSTLFADAKELWEIAAFNNITDIDYTYSQYQAKRDLPTGTCNSNTPCANGACCGSNNLCGYSPASCGSGCQSNCRCYERKELDPLHVIRARTIY